MREGWTLHEMIISLAVAGMIVTLAGSAAVGQLRFYKSVTELTAVRTQVTQSALIAANVLRDVGSAADIHTALDSAIEVSVPYGASVTCRADTGRLVVAGRGPESGATLGAFTETPQPGDAAHVLVPDSAGGWMRIQVAADPVSATCERFASHPGWMIRSTEALVLPAGAPVRFTRRTRLSAYRASDSRWYLGLAEWNAALGRFNTIQPVAGPLLPVTATESATGFLLEYRDAAGSRLASPALPERISLVTVVVRGETRRPARSAGIASDAAPFHGDSAVMSVAIRAP